ncbi:MAG: ABC transporter permease [Spirochaetaceae bacterium]|nr:MAG: ABC transporter permease [Spirochaetaceae bacterium]
MNVNTIHPFALAAIALLIPVGLLISSSLKLGLNKDILVSHTRMLLQLGAVGFFLEWLFNLSGIVPGLLWLTVMIVAATLAVIKASKLRLAIMAGPIGISLAFIAVVHLMIFLLIAGPEVWSTRGLIPIGGMLLGNTMTSIIIGLNEFFGFMRNRTELYELRLGLGHSRLGAALPGIRAGLRRAMAPQLAVAATVGIVSLPGMMTGQILGGSSPVTAVSYQIAIMIAIFSTRLTGSVLVIIAGLKFGTTTMGNLKRVFTDQAETTTC